MDAALLICSIIMKVPARKSITTIIKMAEITKTVNLIVVIAINHTIMVMCMVVVTAARCKSGMITVIVITAKAAVTMIAVLLLMITITGYKLMVDTMIVILAYLRPVYRQHLLIKIIMATKCLQK